MTSNVGWIERIVRTLLAIQASVGYLYLRYSWPRLGYVLLALGITLFFTAIWGYCPVKRFCRRPLRVDEEPRTLP